MAAVMKFTNTSSGTLGRITAGQQYVLVGSYPVGAVLNNAGRLTQSHFSPRDFNPYSTQTGGGQVQTYPQFVSGSSNADGRGILVEYWSDEEDFRIGRSPTYTNR